MHAHRMTGCILGCFFTCWLSPKKFIQDHIKSLLQWFGSFLCVCACVCVSKHKVVLIIITSSVYHAWMWMCMCVWVCICVCLCVCLWVFVYLCVCVFVYTCMTRTTRCQTKINIILFMRVCILWAKIIFVWHTKKFCLDYLLYNVSVCLDKKKSVWILCIHLKTD